MTESNATDDSGATAPYDIGVLLVHGIGSQKQGATLTEWSDSLVDWLESWVADEGSKPAKVTIPETNLAPGDGAPANLTMHVDFQSDRSGRGKRHQRWLMAEGWWAETFDAPTFGELWGWSFKAVPAMLALHTNSVFRAARARYVHAIGFERVSALVRISLLSLSLLVLIAMSPVILVLGTLMLLAGIIVGALPIGILQTVVARLQLVLVGTVGDSLRLLESPTQAGAIKAPVARGLRWLKAQGCERVIVLAHSQGAAVSYQVLSDIGRDHDNGLDKIDAFISVGSGLPKVWAMQNLLADRSRLGLRNAALVTPLAAAVFAVAMRFLAIHDQILGMLGIGVIAVLTVISLVAARKLIPPKRDGTIFTRWDFIGNDGSIVLTLHGAPIIIGAAAAFIWVLVVPFGFATFVATVSGVMVVVGLLIIALGRIPVVADDLAKGTDRWVDLYAAKDPVPAGPTQTRTDGRPEAWPVSNLRSAMRDHTYYTSNLDECMTYIGIELLEVSGVALEARAERDATARYGFQRRWRVGWRSFIGWYLIAATIVFAVRTWGDADDEVRSWWASVFDPNEDALFDRIAPVDRPGFVPDTIGIGASQAIAVVLFVMLALALVMAGQAAWSMWDNHDSKNELATDAVPNQKIEVTFHLRVIIMLLVFVTWIAVWPRGALRAWNALDFGSWTAFAIAGAVALSVFAVGKWIPKVLEAAGMRARFLRVDRTRIDSMASYGRILAERGQIEKSLSAYRRAVRVSEALGDPSANAHGGYGHALDLRARQLVAQGADPGSEEVRELVEAAARQFAVARTIARDNVRNLLLSANFVASVEDAPERAHYLLQRALRLRPHDSGAVGCACRFYFATGDIQRANQHLDTLEDLSSRTSQNVLVDPMLLSGRLAQLAASDADGSERLLQSIRRTIDDGTRCHGVDMRLSLANLHPSWTGERAAALRDLAMVLSTRPSDDDDEDESLASIDALIAVVAGRPVPAGRSS